MLRTMLLARLSLLAVVALAAAPPAVAQQHTEEPEAAHADAHAEEATEEIMVQAMRSRHPC